MTDHDVSPQPPTAREPYQTPRVLEDLPLESFSLACTPGKADEVQCGAEGTIQS